VCVFVHLHVRVCMHVCGLGRIVKWLGHRPGNRKVPSLIPCVTIFGVVIVSLSEKLYLHCFSLSSCLNGDLVA